MYVYMSVYNNMRLKLSVMKTVDRYFGIMDRHLYHPQIHIAIRTQSLAIPGLEPHPTTRSSAHISRST